jgi:hypothetical protein
MVVPALVGEFSFGNQRLLGQNQSLVNAKFNIEGNHLRTRLHDATSGNAAVFFVAKKNIENTAASYALPIVIGLSALLSGVRYDANNDHFSEIGAEEKIYDSYQNNRGEVLNKIDDFDKVGWHVNLFDRYASNDALALSKTTKPLIRALLKGGPESIDLRNLDINKVNGMHLAVILRATSSKRDSVPGWREALTLARAALLRDNINANNALIGLKW